MSRIKEKLIALYTAFAFEPEGLRLGAVLDALGEYGIDRRVLLPLEESGSDEVCLDALRLSSLQ